MRAEEQGMEHIYDVIVIGGGPAGYTAALYAARAGLDVLVLERMSVGGQMMLTDMVENYPGFDEGIEGYALSERMQRGAERAGAKTEYAEVTSVELEGSVKRIGTLSGELFARSVIIATGANPRELGLDGEAALVGRGVHYCAHCDGRFYRGKTVVVVGGGNSAVGDATYLSRLAARVILVHRRDTLRASRAEQRALFAAENVEIMWNTELSRLVCGENGRIRAVRARRGDEEIELSCDGVFISIGRKPATELLFGVLELDGGGYIVADETTRTAIDGVFVAGDVRQKELRQIVTAVSDGAVAAHFAEQYLNLTDE